MTVRILHGDALEQLRTLADDSVHSVVCDPPYGLEFMGKEWDTFKTGRAEKYAKGGGIDSEAIARQSGKGGAGPQYVSRPARRCAKCGKQAWSGSPCACTEPAWTIDNSPLHAFQDWTEAWARECLRVLKPGGHLLSFGGSRTYHRMACAIEDAGFEIRDQIMYLYGSGFPKSLNLDRERGNAFCGCEPDTEHKLPCLQRQDVSPAEAVDPRQGALLQHGMQEQGVSAAGWSELSSAEDGRSESCMEGRRHDLQAQGQLREHSLCASARVGEADGAQRRLLDAAPTSDGGMVRLSTGASRDGASPQPSTDREPANESGTVAGQPQPQARGAWPICDRCGKPMVAKGLGTALKPAHEPIVVARKPLIGTVAANVLKHGTGALNIDACRVDGAPPSVPQPALRPNGTDSGHALGTGLGRNGEMSAAFGRWPANLIHDGSDEVLAGFPDARSAGNYPSGSIGTGNGTTYLPTKPQGDLYADSGSAARFFYTAKASRDDRNIGCDELPPREREAKFGSVQDARPHTPEGYEYHREPRANHHPTVKPTDLMQYLVRLVTPLGGTVLDPFAGSGSTGLAADREGFDAILIEREAEYVEIARRRIVGDCPLFADLTLGLPLEAA